MGNGLIQNLILEGKELLEGPEAMYCERYHARMLTSACLDYQLSHPEACSRCQLGRMVREEYLSKGGKMDNGRPDKAECLVEGCTEPAKYRGMCLPHYKQWQRGKIVVENVPPAKRGRKAYHPKRTDGEDPAPEDVKVTYGEMPQNAPGPYMYVQFYGHEEMYEDLKEVAKKNFRHIDQQILAYVRAGLGIETGLEVE
jgi:hypothetical protein